MFETIDRYVSQFVTLTPAELDLLHAVLKPAAIPARSFLLREGEVCQVEAFILKGCMRKYCLDDTGYEVNLQFAVENWWISDLASFTERKPSALFIQAMEDTDVLQIHYADKERIFREVPALERMFRLMVQRNQNVLQERFVNIIRSTAEDRYQAFLRQYPDLSQRIPQHHIASYLGMSAEFLSKVRKRISLRK